MGPWILCILQSARLAVIQGYDSWKSCCGFNWSASFSADIDLLANSRRAYTQLIVHRLPSRFYSRYSFLEPQVRLSDSFRCLDSVLAMIRGRRCYLPLGRCHSIRAALLTLVSSSGGKSSTFGIALAAPWWSTAK
jgi:hypothetical protein